MAKVLVNESSLQNIANALREKTGSEDTYKPSEMGDAIMSLEIVPPKEWFGDGRDGDLNVEAGQTYVFDVALDEGQIVKQFRSVYIGEGATVKTSGRCNGMVWAVQGDFENHGTITMDKCAPLLNNQEELCANEPHVKLCALTGGNGGNGGGGNTGNGNYATSFYCSAASSGGAGSEGFALGGGFAGGGGGGGAIGQQTGDDRQGQYMNPVANGAPGIRAPIGTAIPYPQASTTANGVGQYGNGGNSNPVNNAKGGAGYGGSGAANYMTRQTNGYMSSPTGYSGKAGDGIGGGLFEVFVAGRCIIGATGVISADGGNGANAVKCGSASYYSGAGGGAGGGIIAIIHSGDMSNLGSIHANGGKCGSSSAYAATDGEAGAVLIATLNELLASA